MHKCPELRKLRKAPRFTSVLLRHQNPGSPAVIINPYNALDVLDPTHPGLKTLKYLPHIKGDAIGVKMLPISLLNKPQLAKWYPFARKFLTWGERVQKAIEAGVKVVYVKGKPTLTWRSGEVVGEDEQVYPEHDHNTLDIPDSKTKPKGPLLDIAQQRATRRVPMSYMTATSKVRMGAKRYTRCQITRRMKVALNLIVTRGAYYGDPSRKNEGLAKEEAKPLAIEGEEVKPKRVVMRFDDEEARSMGRKWIMQGWSYVWFPTMEVYQMPYSQLISRLRRKLTFLNKRANNLEKTWFIDALKTDERSNRIATHTSAKFGPVRLGSNPRDDVRQAQVHEVEGKPLQSSRPSGKPLKLKRPAAKLQPIQPATAPKKLIKTFDNDRWKKELMEGLVLLESSRTTAERGSRRSRKSGATARS